MAGIQYVYSDYLRACSFYSFLGQTYDDISKLTYVDW